MSLSGIWFFFIYIFMGIWLLDNMPSFLVWSNGNNRFVNQHHVSMGHEGICLHNIRVILGMGSVNKRMLYIIMSSHIGWAHTQNDSYKWQLCVPVTTTTLITWNWICAWWRHQMETFSASLAICAGWIRHTKASDAELWCFLWSVS